MSCELSIILPAFNEALVIKENLKTIEHKLNGLKLDYEIIVVNDGSSDNTLEKLSDWPNPDGTVGANQRVKVFSYQRNQGKGYAIGYGMQKANGQYCLFMDVDLSTDLNEIEKFLVLMRQGLSDIVIGNRNMGSLQEQKRPWYRAFLGQGFTLLSALMIGYDCQDFTCGFKMFTQQASQTVFLRQRIFGWAFDTEILLIARLHHLKICQMPVVWEHKGNSKVHIGRDILNSFFSLLKLRYYAFKGYYR